MWSTSSAIGFSSQRGSSGAAACSAAISATTLCASRPASAHASPSGRRPWQQKSSPLRWKTREAAGKLTARSASNVVVSGARGVVDIFVLLRARQGHAGCQLDDQIKPTHYRLVLLFA